MTRRERVLEAVRHQQTDIVPYQVGLTGRAYSRLVDYVGDPGYVESIGNHLAGPSYGRFEEVKPGYRRDQYGVVWNCTVDKDIGVVEGQVLYEPNLAGYREPEIDIKSLRDDMERAHKQAGDLATFYSIGFSLFERAWTLRGMEDLLVDMVAEPKFVDNLLDAICEHNLKIIDIALEYPFDMIYFGDDWGQQKGLIMGPDHWRRFIRPRMARMFERVKSEGRYVILHSCGDIYELFPDLIDIGLDIYHTFQPEIYDVKSVKREYGKNLTFFGGISTQTVLPWVTPQEVKEVVREMIAVVGEGGGYIVSPTHAIPGDVPPENIVALVEACQQQ